MLDEYGATNPAEFFAVATECFFEKPAQIRRKHPQLYEELKEYYRQDPERAITGGEEPHRPERSEIGTGVASGTGKMKSAPQWSQWTVSGCS